MTAAADSPAHDNEKNCMALPATACNEDKDLVDRGNDEGNSGGGDDDDDALVCAKRQR